MYIRHPPKAAADATAAVLPCRFALASKRGAIEREGLSTLPELADAIRRAARVVLLLAASDVSLLRVKVPPLSGVRLKAALPNLVEDQLLSDPAECTFAVGPAQDGMRTVAVVNRARLQQLCATLTALGARQLAAVPAQLCLRYQPGAVTAAVTHYGADSEIAWRWSEQEGSGFCLDTGAGNTEREIIAAMRLIARQAMLRLQVAPDRVVVYQQAAIVAAGGNPELPPLQIDAEDWGACVAAAKDVTLDLIAGLSASAGPQLDWRPWRWPAALALLAMAVNIAGLNVSWLQLRQEADVLQNSMISTFRAAFPKESVIIDPIAQMQQKISAIRESAGQAAPDDFLTLAGAFGNAWGDRPHAAIAALEYRERSLLVRLKPVEAVAADSIRPDLAAHHLVLTEQGAGLWRIRSAR